MQCNAHYTTIALLSLNKSYTIEYLQVIVDGVEYAPACASGNKKTAKAEAAIACLRSLANLPIFRNQNLGVAPRPLFPASSQASILQARMPGNINPATPIRPASTPRPAIRQVRPVRPLMSVPCSRAPMSISRLQVPGRRIGFAHTIRPALLEGIRPAGFGRGAMPSLDFTVDAVDFGDPTNINEFEFGTDDDGDSLEINQQQIDEDEDEDEVEEGELCDGETEQFDFDANTLPPSLFQPRSFIAETQFDDMNFTDDEYGKFNNDDAEFVEDTFNNQQFQEEFVDTGNEELFFEPNVAPAPGVIRPRLPAGYSEILRQMTSRLICSGRGRGLLRTAQPRLSGPTARPRLPGPSAVRNVRPSQGLQRSTGFFRPVRFERPTKMFFRPRPPPVFGSGGFLGELSEFCEDDDYFTGACMFFNEPNPTPSPARQFRLPNLGRGLLSRPNAILPTPRNVHPMIPAMSFHRQFPPTRPRF